jgi:hypothetical protein
MYSLAYLGTTHARRLWTRVSSRSQGMPKNHSMWRQIKMGKNIQSLCEMIGIKDLHVKVEGGQSAQRNVLAIVQAFMTGLNNQETFQVGFFQK